MNRRVVVLGAGPGGYVAALRVAQLGGDVTVVESDHLGGTCLNWGCIPSKIMVTTAQMMRKVQHPETYGIRIDGTPEVDMPALQERKNQVIRSQEKGISSLLAHAGVRHLEGYGRIAGRGRLHVTLPDGTIEPLEWDRLILATGTTPRPLPGLPFDGRRILSSDHALNLDAVPKEILILGGGVIGCEFASILSGLGSRVTLIEASDRILPIPSLEPNISKSLAREFKKEKIRVLTERTVLTTESTDTGVTVLVGPAANARKKSREESLSADGLLVCIGRQANSIDIGLDTVGIVPTDGGWIPVDDRMQTAADGILAIGDITGPDRIMLAHVASMEGRVAADVAMDGTSTMRYNAVPSAIFTHPEVASAGLTLAQAEADGIPARSDAMLFRNLGKAHAIGEIAGEAILVTESGTGRVLGCHMIGPHVSDLIAEATLAIEKGLTATDLAQTIHAHPTLAEIVGEVALKPLGMGLHG